MRKKQQHTASGRQLYYLFPTALSADPLQQSRPQCFSRRGLQCRSTFSDRKTGRHGASALARMSRYSAAGTLRQRNRKQLAPAHDSVIPFFGFRGRLHAGQRTSYGLYNRASSRMPGYTIRLPGLSARGPDQRGARPLVWTLPDAARRGGIA